MAANATGPATSNALVAQVWQAARLDALSASMVENILAGVREHPEVARLSPAKRERVFELYRRHATSERFATRLRTQLEAADDVSLQALIEVTKSPIAARALQHELAFKPVAPELMLEYAVSMRKSEDGFERQAIIERLDRAIGVTEMSVGVAAASVWGTSVAMREFERPQSTLTAENLDQAMGRFIEQIRPFQHEQVQITYLYLYRRMPVDELREYVKLQEAEPVQSLQRRIVRSLGEEMIALQRDVTKDVVRDLRHQGERDA